MTGEFHVTFVGVLLGWAAVLVAVVVLCWIGALIQVRRTRRWRDQRRRDRLEMERLLRERRGEAFPAREDFPPATIHPISMYREAHAARERLRDIKAQGAMRRPLV